MRARVGLSALLLAAATALAACAGERTYRIGVQDETSHALMAEMLAETLRRAGQRTLQVPCGDLRACTRALRAGEIDLMPAYSGDAVALTRGRPADAVADLDKARRAFSLLDLMVSRRFGFEAPYRVTMRSDRAAQAEITAINDLATLEDGVRFAVPEGYAARPGDGLHALSRRHGLVLAPGGPLIVDDATERAAAVLQGAADAAVVRDFAYDLANLGLTRLEDSLGFFPRYEAVVLIGPSAAGALPDLQGAMSPLMGRLGVADMRELMQEVLVQGWTPAHAARRLLVDRGIARELGPGIERPPLVLALDPREELGAQQEVAARVVSRAFPERPVTFLNVYDPLGALAAGQAEIALVDAAHFFTYGRGGPFGARDNRGEAAAVIGDRRLYLLRPSGVRGPDPLAGAVGTQPFGSSGSRIATALLSELGRDVAVHAPLAALLRQLDAGELDAALVLAPARPAAIVQALQDGRIRVQSLTPHVADVPFFLVDTRIPAGSLPGQDAPIDTFSMQLLLAGAAPRADYALRSGGPASAILTAGQPLTQPEAEALARASPTAERPDPILQSVWERTPTRREAERGLLTDVFDTALNIAVFAFAAWVGWLLVRRNSTPPGASAGAPDSLRHGRRTRKRLSSR